MFDSAKANCGVSPYSRKFQLIFKGVNSPLGIRGPYLEITTTKINFFLLQLAFSLNVIPFPFKT